MPKSLTIAAALAGGLLFALMVKLMWDMTSHVGRMADDVGVMSGRVVAMSEDMHAMRLQFERLSNQVGDIEQSVEVLLPLGVDIQAMRVSMERMSGVILKGGKQIENLSPGGMMQQMLGQPPGNR